MVVAELGRVHPGAELLHRRDDDVQRLAVGGKAVAVAIALVQPQTVKQLIGQVDIELGERCLHALFVVLVPLHGGHLPRLTEAKEG